MSRRPIIVSGKAFEIYCIGIRMDMDIIIQVVAKTCQQIRCYPFQRASVKAQILIADQYPGLFRLIAPQPPGVLRIDRVTGIQLVVPRIISRPDIRPYREIELSVEVERLMIARLDAMSEEEAQRLLTSDTAQASV